MTTSIYSQFITYLITLLAITNPIGNLAIFLSLTAERPPSEQRHTALITAFACLIIFLIVTWFGELVLKIMGISVAEVQLAGGIIITLLGLSMLHTEVSPMTHTKEEANSAKQKDSIAVVPMAMPIIAGPGAIATILASLQHYHQFTAKFILSGGDVIVAAVIALTLFFGSHLGRLLGVSGVKITTRIMGLILVAMAMGMFTSGLASIFPAWVGHP